MRLCRPHSTVLHGTRCTACGSAGCKRLKKQTGRSQQARSGHGIILSDSDSDTDMEGSGRAPSPARTRVPSLRAAASRSSTGRHRQGRAGTGRAGQSSHGQGRANDTDWESEAAELAEEEATLDVSLTFADLTVLPFTTCSFSCFLDPANTGFINAKTTSVPGVHAACIQVKREPM